MNEDLTCPLNDGYQIAEKVLTTDIVSSQHALFRDLKQQIIDH